MRLEPLLRFCFVQYCVAAGVLLTFAPWSLAWAKVILQIPSLDIVSLLELPSVRGGVSGFGLVHLVWAVHDLRLMLLQVRAQQEP